MKKIYIAKTKEAMAEFLCDTVKQDDLGYYIEDTNENRIKHDDIIPFGFSKKNKKIKISIVNNSKTSTLENPLTKNSYDKIKEPFVAECGGRCQICGNVGGGNQLKMKGIDIHEIWEYIEEEERNVQKLIGFLCLCSDCHLMFHLGLSKTIGKEIQTLKRIKSIENIDEKELQLKIQNMIMLSKDRSKKKWIIDLTILKDFGFFCLEFKNNVNVNDFIK